MAACIKAVADTVRGSARVSDSKNGWITVYDEQSEKQSTSELEHIAEQLSSKLDTHVFAFLLHDSDVFMYLLNHQGKRIDRFNSAPDYFGSVETSEDKTWAGNCAKLLPLAKKGTTLAEMENVLKKKYVFHEDMISDFAPLFGIDPDRACSGFEYAQDEPHESYEFQTVYARNHAPDAAALAQSQGFAKLAQKVDSGNLAGMKKLLAQGVSPNGRSSCGHSLLLEAIRLMAMRFDKPEITLALLEAGADPFADKNDKVICQAAVHGYRDVLARILQHPDKEKLKASFPTALSCAVSGGKLEVVEDLLKAGADPNAAQPLGKPPLDGMPPLLIACFRGPQLMALAARKNVPSNDPFFQRGWAAIVTLLLQAGANVNFQASNGATALSMAQASGQSDLVEILLKAGANKPNDKEVSQATEILKEAGIGKPQESSAQTTSKSSSSVEAVELMMKQLPQLDPEARKALLESTVEAMAKEELPHVLNPGKIKTLMEHRNKSLERSKPSLEKMMKAQIESAVEAMAMKEFPHDPEKRKIFIEQRTTSLEKKMKEQLESSIAAMAKEELPPFLDPETRNAFVEQRKTLLEKLMKAQLSSKKK